MNSYKIFVSHGSQDLWLGGQIAKELAVLGGAPFLDETNIPKGSPDYKTIIRQEVAASRELVALFTPWSAMRSWVWIELGAAWSRQKPILAVFYRMTAGQGKAILEDINTIDLNEFDIYLKQLKVRLKDSRV
jgi:hypothetical protein